MLARIPTMRRLPASLLVLVPVLVLAPRPSAAADPGDSPDAPAAAGPLPAAIAGLEVRTNILARLDAEERWVAILDLSGNAAFGTLVQAHLAGSRRLAEAGAELGPDHPDVRRAAGLAAEDRQQLHRAVEDL